MYLSFYGGIMSDEMEKDPKGTGAEEPAQEAAPAAGAEDKKEEAAKPEPAAEAPKEEEAAPAEPKGPAFTPRSTTPANPTECAASGKALRKKLWYYRNGNFFLNKKAYKVKAAKDKEAAAENK